MRLTGEFVALRPFRPDEVETVWQARRRGGLPLGVAPGARERFAERLRNSGRLVDGWLDLAIELEGRLVGEIDARQPPQALPPGVFELGIALFEPAERGRGYGSEAVALLTRHLFAELGAERVQASTSVGNAAMRRVFTKLGFAEEGVMRAFMPGPAGRDDYALYAVTRADWRETRARPG